MRILPKPEIEKPDRRGLWIYSIDPALSLSLKSIEIAKTKIDVPWRDLDPDSGPKPERISGEYFEVIDFDPSINRSYEPLNPNDPYLRDGGLEPNESNPQFHQQMVYAVAMHTVGTFESALGRTVLWSLRRDNGRFDYVDKLWIYPHAMREANAYYDPRRKALLFGYFPAQASGARKINPGLVFSSLSFDIISHETTHAILDGIHPRFIEDTNPDVPAFHEAFADIVALFQHFSLPDLLRYVIAHSRGDLRTDNYLGQLAVQFGQGMGQYGALRDAIGKFENGKWIPKKPEDFDVSKVAEPHARGSILVSAVFEAFLNIYDKRTEDLIKLASDGSGVLRPGAIPAELIGRLADEAQKAAKHVLQMCIRALDYMPPVDPTFGEFLRAIVTADYDIAPKDPRSYRVAFIEAFRRWGIMPDDLNTLGECDLRWKQFGGEIDEAILDEAIGPWIDDFREVIREPICDYTRLSMTPPKSSARGRRGKTGREAQTESRPASRRERIFTWSCDAQKSVHKWLNEQLRKDVHLSQFTGEKSGQKSEEGIAALVLGLIPSFSDQADSGPSRKIEVHSVRPILRNTVEEHQRPKHDLVIVATQKVFLRVSDLKEDTDLESVGKRLESGETVVFRGGSTIIYDLDRGEFRYVIRKNILSENRRKQQATYQAGAPKSLYFGDTEEEQFFRALHGEEL